MIFPERVFGSASAKRMSSGVATGPMTVRTCFFSSLASSWLGLHAGLDGDEADHGLAFQFVGTSDDRGFRDGGMRDERAFDFGGAEAVAGDVEHVVDAADDPEVAVLVAPRAVAGEVACL